MKNNEDCRTRAKKEKRSYVDILAGEKQRRSELRSGSSESHAFRPNMAQIRMEIYHTQEVMVLLLLDRREEVCTTSQVRRYLLHLLLTQSSPVTRSHHMYYTNHHPFPLALTYSI